MGRSLRRFALATMMLGLAGLLPALALGSTERPFPAGTFFAVPGTGSAQLWP